MILFARHTMLCLLLASPLLQAETTPEASGSGAGAEVAPQGVDRQVQDLKQELVALNRELFKLEEELLYPASTQVAVFVAVDVGTFFALDSLTIELDGDEVAHYLYTEREVEALHRGAVQRVFVGNLKAGEHELVAFFTGKGPHERDYRRGTTLKFEKSVGARFLELKISDRVSALQPEFVVREWEP
jgi:hypothetical protein